MAPLVAAVFDHLAERGEGGGSQGFGSDLQDGSTAAEMNQ
jgi:hypothetical protein